MKNKSTDELLQPLQWITDRQKYRRDCKIVDGAAYAEECKVESAALAELTRRGYFGRQ